MPALELTRRGPTSPSSPEPAREAQRTEPRIGRRCACLAETLCGYGKFGVESTKQVLWANLEASGIEAALHVENRSQILA